MGWVWGLVPCCLRCVYSSRHPTDGPLLFAFRIIPHELNPLQYQTAETPYTLIRLDSHVAKFVTVGWSGETFRSLNADGDRWFLFCVCELSADEALSRDWMGDGGGVLLGSEKGGDGDLVARNQRRRLTSLKICGLCVGQAPIAAAPSVLSCLSWNGGDDMLG